MKLTKNLKLAIEASLQAGKKIIEIYNSDDFNLEYKLDDSPLTIADTASNKIIENILEASNIPILSEEGNILDFNNRKNLKQLWIVDPLDGTKEFIKKNDEFTVNIALIENSKPVIGVIYAPALNVLYFSERKLGSYKTLITALDEFDNSKAFRLPLVENSNEYKVLTSRSHLDDNTLDYIDNLKVNNLKAVSVPMGSSLKFCLLAEGLADCYPRFSPCMEWDTAAGQIICEEAGFKVIDLKTMKPIIYNRENLINNYFIAKK
ncbi:3'(2'),5'-bisphosphate nucleotidase CysQ [Flavobacteriaceae bacterium]|nr:3'(2'),5'-bisphosphate nucleotidase CysQ [Flavobacteriaceae bacterium]